MDRRRENKAALERDKRSKPKINYNEVKEEEGGIKASAKVNEITDILSFETSDTDIKKLSE